MAQQTTVKGVGRHVFILAFLDRTAEGFLLVVAGSTLTATCGKFAPVGYTNSTIGASDCTLFAPSYLHFTCSALGRKCQGIFFFSADLALDLVCWRCTS